MADSPWPELYREYLRSHEWALRRAKVMRRANHVCEGCGDHPAVDVHHRSYEHVTREFLFELVALCAGCHERIHQQPGAAERPRETTWTPRLAKPTTASEVRKAMESSLAIKAAEARRKFMAKKPEPPPHDDVPEAMEAP